MIFIKPSEKIQTINDSTVLGEGRGEIPVRDSIVYNSINTNMGSTVHFVTAILETGLIGFVVYMIIKGLKTEVKTLQTQINNQNETIKTMDKRIEETEKIGDLYKRLVSDFPQAIDDYQTVITKTKDSTIYELKSKVEEQKLAISELKSRAEHGDQRTSARTVGVGKLFLDKDKKELLQFVQSLEPDKDKLIHSLLKNEDFNRFLSDLNKRIELVPEEETLKVIHPDKMEEYKARNATFGKKGSFMVTLDDKVYINRSTLNVFKEGYEKL